MEEASTKEGLAKLLKSILVGSKEGVLLRNLQKEYHMFVGSSIPFRSMGYNSLEDLLRSMPETVRLERNHLSEVICRAVVDDKTKHINELVSKTRTSKSKSKQNRRRLQNSASNSLLPYRRSSPAMHRPHKYPYRKGPQQTYRAENYANNRPPLISKQHYSNNNPMQSNQIPPSQPKKPLRYEKPPRFNKQSNGEDKPDLNGYDKPYWPKRSSDEKYEHSERSSGTAKSPTSPNASFSTSATALNFGNSNIGLENFAVTSNFESKTRNVEIHSTKSSFANSLPTNISENSVPLYSARKLKVQLPSQFGNEAQETRIPSQTPPSRPVITPEVSISPEPVYPVQNPKSETYVKVVENYAKIKGILPTFKTVPIAMKQGGKQKPKKCYWSTLTLADRKFYSYPSEKATPQEADEEAAKKAVEALKLDEEDPFFSLPTTPCSTEDEINTMLERIVEIVGPKNNGIFHLNVEKRFEEVYKQSLPTTWLTTTEKKHILKIEAMAGDSDCLRFILYPLSSGTASPASFEERVTPISESGSSQSLPETLALPEDEQWEVYITHIANTLDVTLRLIKYSQDFEELALKMKKHYQTSRMPVKQVTPGDIYCLEEFGEDETWWHRVEVCNVEDEQATCFFVDFGHIEVVHIEKLRDLDGSFLTLPFQAISCQLSGIEYLVDDVAVTRQFIDLALHKTLVALVKSREDGVSLNLYDTSSDEDININKTLLDFALSTSLAATFPEKSMIGEAYISHVTEKGDIYLQTNLIGLKILDDLINDILDQLEERVGKENEVSSSKMYIAKRVNHQWSRALVLASSKSSINKNEVLVNYFDYGVVETIPLVNLVDLDSLSGILTKYPTQALVCRLHEVPTSPILLWTPQVTKRLLEMVPSTQLLSVKAVPEDKANAQSRSQVHLFKRNELNELISLNQTLALAEDLFDVIPDLPISPIRVSRPNTIPLRSQRNSQSSIVSPTILSSPTMLSSPSPLNSFHSPLDASADHGDLVGPPLRQVRVPDVNSRFDVLVLWGAHPDLFFVQSRNDLTAYNVLYEDMQNFYNVEENIIDFEMCLLQTGNFYAVKHSDGAWYRGWVSQITSFEPVEVVVYLVDYGEFVQAGIGSIQKLWIRFCKLPFQAIKTKLADIEPLNGDYEMSHIVAFQQMVTNKQFVTMIKSKEVDKSIELESYKLTLELIDTSSSDDIYVGKTLVEKGFAKATSS